MEENYKDETNNLLNNNGNGSTLPFTTNKSTLYERDAQRRQPSCWRHFLRMEKDDFTSLLFWRACFAEFIGVFLLCFYTIGVGCHMPGTPGISLGQAAISVTFFLTALVSALATVSGCHVNPAVTAAFATLRHISLTRTFFYIIFQCAGGVAGSIALRELLHPDMVGHLGVIAPGKDISDSKAVCMEFIITAFLMFLLVALLDKGRTDVNFSIPFAISLCVGANIYVAGNVSGAGMNPARAIGPAVAMGNYDKQWIYWLGPVLGAIFGGLLYDKIFSVGASLKHCLSCCKPGDRSIEAPVTKEATMMMTLERIATNPGEIHNGVESTT